MTMLGGFLGVNAIDGSYWSLFIELRFYFLIFILLLLKKIHYAQTALTLWLFVSLLLEFQPIGILRSIFITDYAAFFIAGATCFLIWAESLSLSKGLLLLSAWALSEYETLSMLPSIEQHYQTEFNRITIIGIVSSFFLVLFLIAQRWTGFFANQGWLVLGALTYPLYLIHQNIGYIIFDKFYPSINAHLLFWGTLGLMLLLAYGIYVLFEKRLARYLRHWLEHLFGATQVTHTTKSFSSAN